MDRSGPSTGPSGTSLNTVIQLEYMLPVATLCLLPDNQLLTHAIVPGL